jgi:hypothetical protein
LQVKNQFGGENMSKIDWNIKFQLIGVVIMLVSYFLPWYKGYLAWGFGSYDFYMSDFTAFYNLGVAYATPFCLLMIALTSFKKSKVTRLGMGKDFFNGALWKKMAISLLLIAIVGVHLVLVYGNGIPMDTYNFARARSRDVYFMFGGYIFLIGFLITLLFAYTEEESEGEEIQSIRAEEKDLDTYVKCPQCAEDIRLEAKRCKHCNSVFSEAEVSDRITSFKNDAILKSNADRFSRRYK